MSASLVAMQQSPSQIVESLKGMFYGFKTGYFQQVKEIKQDFEASGRPFAEILADKPEFTQLDAIIKLEPTLFDALDRFIRNEVASIERLKSLRELITVYVDQASLTFRTNPANLSYGVNKPPHIKLANDIAEVLGILISKINTSATYTHATLPPTARTTTTA